MEIKLRHRPAILNSRTLKVKTGCGNMYVIISEDENHPIELFAILGKAGGCMASQSEAIGRLISLLFRLGVAPEKIIEELRGIRCPSPVFIEDSEILSCADSIAKAISIYLQTQQKDKTG